MTRPSTLRRAVSAKSLRALCISFLALLATPARAGDPPAPTPDPPLRRTGPVTITATRGEREVLDVPGNVTVIDREAIERSRPRNVPDLLRRQAGLSVVETTTNPAGTTVEARGFNNGGSLGSSLLVLVDGRRVNEADTANTDWALIPLDAVERIEIVRGPASAVWGDNAVGGVVNIVTRPKPGPPRATLRGGGGSFHSGRGNLSASGTLGIASGSLFVGGHTTNSYRNRASFDAVAVEPQLELQLGEHVAWGVGGGWHDDERQFPGALTKAEIRLLGRRAAAPGVLKDGDDVERGFVRSWLEAALGDAVLLRIQPWYNGRDDNVVITSDFSGETTIDFDKTSIGFDSQLQVDHAIGPARNRLTVGFTFLRDETDRNILSDFGPLFSRNDRNVYAGFVQNEFNLTRDLLFSGGVRFDHADYELKATDGIGSDKASPDFDIWSPKAAITWRVIEPAALYVSYAQGFRLPNFDENAPLIFADPPDLEEQRSASFEIGAKLQTERVNGALALYHMQVKDEIVYDPVAFSNENFDRVRHRGIELSLFAQVLDWLQLYGTYTLEDVQIRKYKPNPAFKGKRMPINPLHRGTLGALVDLPYWTELGVNANLVGERYLANDFANALPKLDSYATVDLLLTLRPPLARLGEWAEHVTGALSFAVRNVGDEEYFLFGADNAPFGAPGFNPAPKRSFEGYLRLTVAR